jgi:hypothetical protein
MGRSDETSLRHSWPLTACILNQIVNKVDGIVLMERRI